MNVTRLISQNRTSTGSLISSNTRHLIRNHADFNIPFLPSTIIFTTNPHLLNRPTTTRSTSSLRRNMLLPTARPQLPLRQIHRPVVPSRRNRCPLHQRMYLRDCRLLYKRTQNLSSCPPTRVHGLPHVPRDMIVQRVKDL